MANELMARRPYVDAYAALEEGRQRAIARQNEEQANELAAAMQAASAAAVRNGMIDPNIFGEELARAGYASAIPSAQQNLFGVQESAGKARKAMGEGLEAVTKGAAAKFQLFKQQLPVNNPALLPRWVEAVYADPDIGPMMSSMASKEEVIAGIPRDEKGLTEWMEGASMLADEVMKRRTPSAESLLPYTQEMSPSVFAQQLDLKTAGAPRTTIGPQERAESGAYGTFLQTSYQEVRDRANRGRRFLPSLELAAKTLETGLQTGFGAEFKKDAQKVLMGLGLSTEEAKANVENAELFQSVIKTQVLNRLAEQKGPQTDQDAARAEQTIAGLDKSTDVNKFLIALEKAVTKQDIAQEKFYRDWRDRNKTFDGAEAAWFAGPGSKSIFDEPELKKFTKKQGEMPPPPPGMRINR